MIIILVFLIFFSLPLEGCHSANQQKITTAFQTEPRTLSPEGLHSWDFGRVKAGAILRHDFVFTNDSQATLNIKNIDTSCGCTISTVEKKSLAPGEGTLIKVEFNSQGYSGPTKQFIYVHTDNLDNPVVKYIIEADIEK